MQRSSLYIALVSSALFLFPMIGYTQSYYYEDVDGRGYEYDSNSSSNYHYAQARHHYRYYNDGYYSQRRNYDYDYDDDYYYQRRRAYRRSYNQEHAYNRRSEYSSNSSYYSRLPNQINAPGEKLIVVDPRVHAWGAYTPDGKLLKAGLVTAGSNYCPDIHRPCRTRPGSFRIYSLGSASCKSTRYPVGRGGAPMPYCMYFNKNMALHGSHEVAEANISHGCVRMHVGDAEWLRFNFAKVGTKVVVRPY